MTSERQGTGERKADPSPRWPKKKEEKPSIWQGVLSGRGSRYDGAFLNEKERSSCDAEGGPMDEGERREKASKALSR